MQFPVFKYHPDPVGTRTFVSSDAECQVCNQKTGYVYEGPVYFDDCRDDENGLSICPWCIASGKAHEALQVEFSDLALIGSDFDPEGKVSQEAKDEILERTPGFITWQDQVWLSHCKDACQYLGRAGGPEIRSQHPEVITQIEEDYCPDNLEIEEYLDDIDKEGSPVALIFQCRHCGHKQCHLEAD